MIWHRYRKDLLPIAEDLPLIAENLPPIAED